MHLSRYLWLCLPQQIREPLKTLSPSLFSSLPPSFPPFSLPLILPLLLLSIAFDTAVTEETNPQPFMWFVWILYGGLCVSFSSLRGQVGKRNIIHHFWARWLSSRAGNICYCWSLCKWVLMSRNYDRRPIQVLNYITLSNYASRISEYHEHND